MAAAAVAISGTRIDSIGYIKRYRILNGIYRGKIDKETQQGENSELCTAVKIIIHSSAIYMHKHPRMSQLITSTDVFSEWSDTDIETEAKLNRRLDKDGYVDHSQWDPSVAAVLVLTGLFGS